MRSSCAARASSPSVATRPLRWLTPLPPPPLHFISRIPIVQVYDLLNMGNGKCLQVRWNIQNGFFVQVQLPTRPLLSTLVAF